MNKIFIFFIYFNASLFAQGSAWFFEDNPYSFHSIPYVQFIDENNGWAIPLYPPAINNAMFKTTDGGENWFCASPLEITSNPLPQKPFVFTDVDTGYYYSVVWPDYSYKLWKTVDGGINWDQIYTFPVFKIPQNTFFLNGQDGWIVLKQYLPNLIQVLRTYDGGHNWSVLDTLNYATDGYFNFFNPTTGLMLQPNYNSSSLIKTTDGGITWDTISNWNTSVTSMKFKNESIGYATYNGNLYSTLNGGITWNPFNLMGYNLDKVDITKNSFIVTSGYRTFPVYKGSIHVSNDAGISWTTTEFNGNLVDLLSIKKDDEFFISESSFLTLAKNLGTTWEKVVLGPTYNLESIVSVQEGEPFAVGWKQDSLTNNFESAIVTSPPLWRAKSKHPNMKFNCSAVYNNLEIFIGGYEFTNGGRSIIMKCNGDGDSLRLVYNNNNQPINDLYFVNSNIGFAVGDNGLVLKTTDGGENWYEPQSFTTKNLNTVYFNTSLGFIGGADGLLAKTTNEGLNWSEISIGNSKEINSIFFRDGNNIWVAGIEGLLLKSGDGGLSWTPATIPTEFNLNYITGIDPYITIAFGEDAQSDTSIMYESINGGISWNLVRLPQTKGINSAVKGSETLWAVGNFGTIIQSSVWYTPVELKSFNANLSNQKVQLSWSTATELNNRGFEIERSFDKNEWRIIGYREGNGTTSEPQEYSYSDDISEIAASKLYYRLKQIDFNGAFEYSDVIEVDVTPLEFSLSQNFPNPFNPVTTIKYSIPNVTLSGVEGARVQLRIYDVLGNQVATLDDEDREAGSYEIEFDGSKLASGVYYYQLRVGEFVESKKMILLK